MTAEAILESTTTNPSPGSPGGTDALCPRTHTAELVIAAKRGDRAAFGQLVERYTRLVHYVILRRLGDGADAQELAQEVFLQAMCKLDQLREPERFGGWLRSIAARMAINAAVRRRRPLTGEGDALEAACVERTTPLACALSAERAAQLRAGLRRLSALDRQTLEEFYFDGRSLVEMSARFGSPVGTIKRRLHVARKRLARELSDTETARS